MNTIKKILSKYGFYMAVLLVSAGAVAAVFLMGEEEKISSQETASSYYEREDDVQQKGDGKNFVLDPSLVPSTDQEEESIEVSSALVEEDAVSSTKEETESIVTDQVGELTTETFSSTTATEKEPFLQEGDLFVSPVENGAVIVPYTDETTTHWFSESLNQTIRTNGICMGGSDGDHIELGAAGTVMAITEDSTSFSDAQLPGNIGKLIQVDHGNGYVSLYGIQKGELVPNLEVGDYVTQGAIIGTIGAPTGPFITEGSNVYLQVTKDGVPVNPESILNE